MCGCVCTHVDVCVYVCVQHSIFLLTKVGTVYIHVNTYNMYMCLLAKFGIIFGIFQALMCTCTCVFTSVCVRECVSIICV